MAMLKKSKLNNRILLIYLIIVVTSLFVSYKSANLSFLNDTNSFQIEASTFNPDFNSRSLSFGDERQSYETLIAKEDILNITESEDKYFILFSYHLSDNAYEIYFNDTLIGARGDMEEGNSNLWNSYGYHLISKDLLEDTNTLRYETYGKYWTGLYGYPIYIVNQSISSTLLNTVSIFGEKAIAFCIGFIILAALIATLLISVSKRNINLYFFNAMSSLFLGIYALDFLSIESLSVDYFTYKKLIMSGLFFGVSLYSLAIASYYKSNKLKILAGITGFGFILIVVFSESIHTFKNLYTPYYFMISLNMAFWIILSYKKRREYTSSLFFIGFSVIGVYAFIAMSLDYFSLPIVLNSPIVFISIVGSVPMLLAYENFHEREAQLSRQKSYTKRYIKDMVTDDLTGAYNRRHLMNTLSTIDNKTCIALIDLDDFKKVNDQYGHVAGDYVLKSFVERINTLIRTEDSLFRFGGDEFIILFNDLEYMKSTQLASRLVDYFAQTPIDYNESQIPITLSIGIHRLNESLSIEENISTVDKYLYRAKSAGKNRASYSITV